ncbi:MAG: type II toxin-antitoxin system prevent-host-death family antitoxin, partial [Actinomycetota bacterium]
MVIPKGWSVVGVAEAKAKISELLERVSQGERVVVARRGKPVAVLAPPDAVSDDVARPGGLATLAGVLAEWPALERDMDQVIESRRTARD